MTYRGVHSFQKCGFCVCLCICKCWHHLRIISRRTQFEHCAKIFKIYLTTEMSIFEILVDSPFLVKSGCSCLQVHNWQPRSSDIFNTHRSNLLCKSFSSATSGYNIQTFLYRFSSDSFKEWP